MKRYRSKTAFFNVGIEGNERLWTYDYDSEVAELIGTNTRTIFERLVWELNNARQTNIQLIF
jgi:hypothetical protein